MKKTSLTAVALAAALTLSGCGIYTTAAQSGLPKGPEVSQTKETVSMTEQVPPGPAASDPVVPDKSAAPAQPPAAARLTKAEAEAIALKHAGFTAQQVKGLRSELDIDSGIAHYEVEFRVGQWEYEYEIHAETGAVLSFEKDD